LDDAWHHIAVTWNYDDGVTRMYMDGQPKTAFWKNSGGMLDDKPASQGGVDPSLAARTARSQTGSLVLGQVRLDCSEKRCCCFEFDCLVQGCFDVGQHA
jgi:hypothetical protein